MTFNLYKINETKEQHKRRQKQIKNNKADIKRRRDEDRRRNDWDNSISNPISPISIAIDIATPGGMF